MTELSITCHQAFDGWNCHVTVADDDGTTTDHDVSVTRTERERHGPGSDVHVLVDESFRFLLSKEPKEAILGHFALSDIERYFPSYANAVAARLGE